MAVSLITLFNVWSRYVFDHTLSGAEETATYLFAWMVMIGAALAVKTRQHFVIEFVIDRITGKAGLLARVCVAALVVVAAGIVFVYGLIYMSWGWHSVTPATEVSLALPYGAVAAGGGLMVIRSIGIFVDEITRVKACWGADAEGQP